MRVHALRFAALGPFAGEEFIDFDALGPNALFLIDGPTGAGKSTIIDAMVFALYGDVAGESSDKERLRSAFAAPSIESFAELEFSTAAGRFRVRRTPAYERAKKRGSGTTTEAAGVLVWRAIGEHGWEPLSARAAEADAEIARAVGLSRSQFLQTVVLPQGEFATFLRAESAERLPILERIFATEIYSRIQGEFDERRRAAVRAHEQSLQGLQSARDVLRGQLEGTSIEFSVEHDPLAWSHEREGLLELLRSRATKTAAEAGRQDASLATVSTRMDALIALDTAAQARESARTRFEQANERVLELEAQAGGPADLERTIGDLEIEIGACAADSALETALPGLVRQFSEAESAVTALLDSLTELELDREHVIPARMAASLSALRSQVVAGEIELDVHERRLSDVREARIRGLAGELAAALAPGDPCPVCGAVEHPRPAEVGADHVGADEVLEEEARLGARRADLQGLRTSVAVFEAAIPTDVDAQEPARDTRASLISALERDVANLGGIALSIDGLRTRIAAAESTRANLDARIAEDRLRIEEARGEFATVSDRSDSLRARLELLTSLREARALSNQAAESLRSFVDDDALSTAVEGDLAAVRAEREAASSAARQAGSDAAAAARLLRVVGDLCGGVDEAQAAHARVVAANASVIRLAHALTGAGGQSLSSYVVQRAFDEVVEAANARLAAMLGGHFRLVTTHERTGTRRTALGLGLKIRDLRTDTERRTTTLSGGETFCASLALALGLADSVRAHAGGVEIGMLLIDEGFGALDMDRLGDVMDELARLRADGRSIGVISHVTEMKQAISERIDVHPGPSGSTLSVRWME